MKFSEADAADGYLIRAYEKGRIQVGDRSYGTSLIIAPDRIICDWRPQSTDDLAAADFAPVLALEPEIILLGTGAAQVFPDVNLVGNWLFVLIYFAIGLVFNIFGEEIYYRGYLLPRMQGVFGRWSWAANGVLFTLKHVYQRWMYPGILVGGLCFAFAAGPLGSLPLAMVFHWVGNFLFQMIFLILTVFGAG